MALSKEQIIQAAEARQILGDKQKEAQRKLDAIKAKKSEIDQVLLGELSEDMPSMATSHGVIASKETDRFSVENPAAFRRYMKEADDYSMLTKAVSADGVREYRDSNDGELPPGISCFTQISLSFTKPRKAAPKR